MSEKQKHPSDVRPGDRIFAAASVAIGECRCGTPHLYLLDARGNAVATATLDPDWVPLLISQILERCGPQVARAVAAALRQH